MSDTTIRPSAVLYVDFPDGTVHASAQGSAHVLVWHRDALTLVGHVTMDEQTRCMGLAFDEHAFKVQAESFFRVKHAAPASLLEWQRRWDRDAVATALDAAADAVERADDVSDALRVATGDSPRIYTQAARAFVQHGTGHTLRGFAERYTVSELAAQMRSVALAVRTQGGTR